LAKKTKKKTAKKRTRRSSLKTVSLSELQAEVARRASDVGGLIAERDELAARVAELDEQIQLLSSLSGSATPARRGPGRPAKKRGRPAGSKNRTTKRATKRTPGRKRPKNSMNLSESMAKMLKGKTMGVNEAATNVQKAGYKTNSANFRTIVNQTLIKDPRFKKVARGQYTAA
jgi:hypothetical protein